MIKCSGCANFLIYFRHNLYCLQRRNCQTRHATRHFWEHEIFFRQNHKLRALRYLKNCINEKKRLCYAINEGIFRKYFSKLLQIWEKCMRYFPLCKRIKCCVDNTLSCVTFLEISGTYANMSPIFFGIMFFL